MSDRYRLGGLENDQLLASLKALVRLENESLSDVLAHLAELDERGLCLELGYSSLFKYCVEALGFCESSAGRRILAARVCGRYPAAFAHVANGELKLSVLCALNKHLSNENSSELFEVCGSKSYEQVELVLAARFPKPDVRDLVRRLPARAAQGAPDVQVTPYIECAKVADTAAAGEASLPTSSTVEPGPQLAAASRASGAMPPRCSRLGTVKPLSAERFSVNFTADAEFKELLEEVRALVSHAEPKGELLNVMKRGLAALKAELLKKRFAVGRKPRRVRVKANGGLSTLTRYVAADVTRTVWERDEGRCTFCSEDGRRCDERLFLQLDHIEPYARGGAPTVANLRLRCRGHNLHSARLRFGTEARTGARARA